MSRTEIEIKTIIMRIVHLDAATEIEIVIEEVDKEIMTGYANANEDEKSMLRPAIIAPSGDDIKNLESYL